MPRHCGASQYHDGSLISRTRKSRKERGRKKQSWKDTHIDSKAPQSLPKGTREVGRGDSPS